MTAASSSDESSPRLKRTIVSSSCRAGSAAAFCGAWLPTQFLERRALTSPVFLRAMRFERRLGRAYVALSAE